MTTQKLYAASFGAYLYDDSVLLGDADSDFPSMYRDASMTEGYHVMGGMRLLDTDQSNFLTVTWAEGDTSNRTLGILVKSGNRTFTLYENLEVADGYDFTLQALGQANQLTLNENLTVGDGYAITLTAEDASAAVVLDNVNFEVENTDGTQRSIKITSAKAGDTTLTLQEDLTLADGYNLSLQALGQANAIVFNEGFTIGDGNAGTLTFSGASKTLTVEDDSVVDQDLTTDASPTFAGFTIDALAITDIFDEDAMGSDSATALATQQSIKAYVDSNIGSHTHDGDTLQLDGINSDGGAFSFTTSGTLTFSNTVALTTCIDAGADVDKFLVLDGSNNIDYRTGAEVLSDIGAALGEAGSAAGQMLFWDTTKWAHTEITELFWDDTNKRLGIGVETPQQSLHIKETSASAKMQIHTTFATGYAEILFENEGNVPSSWSFRSIAGDGSFQFVDYDNSTVPIRIEKGALTDTLYLKSTGRVGIGISTPLSKLHVDQASTTAAIPSLYLNQADISEQMITFNTTIGVGNAIEAIGAKTLTTTHFIKVTLPGPLTRYFPVGTIA